LIIYPNEDLINKVTTLPKGIKWSKDERHEAVSAKRGFFFPNEQPEEDKNGIGRDILPPPWDEVAYHILKYIYFEGRLIIVYDYQFRLLYQLIFHVKLPVHERLSIPHFLLQFMR